MRKLLIVDDEFIFRQGLRYMTDWESYGYTVVGEAANGKEALAFLENTSVDFILCDVIMPVMDGVSFVKSMSTNECSPTIIMLSNYDEYDKVRIAFKYGAYDYFLKSRVSKTDLLECFERAAPITHRQKAAEHSFNSLVRRTLDGYDDTTCENLFNYISSKTYYNCFYMIFFDCPQKYFSSALLLKDKLNTIFNNEYCECAFTSQNHGIALISFKNEQSDKNINEYLINLNKFFTQCTTVLSCPFNKIKNFKDMAEKLYLLSKNSIFYSNKSCFYENELIICEKDVPFDSQSYFSCVELLNWNEAKGLLMDYIEKTSNLKSMSAYSFKKFLENTLYQTMAYVKKFSDNISEFDTIELKLFKKLDVATSFNNIQTIVYEFFNDITNICQTNFHPQSTIIRFVKDFIEENYTNSITLRDAADKLHLNYSYLSYYISQNSNTHFNEIVNEVRIRHAKDLLNSTDISISAISEEIGFSDQSYFGKIFKKIVGVTPLQYRNKAGGKM